MQPFDIYDALIEGLPAGLRVKSYINGKIWTMAETDEGAYGLAMTYDAASIPPVWREDYVGMDLRDLAALSKSWNFPEAAIGMAAINAWFNKEERARAAGVLFPDPLRGVQDAFSVYLSRAEGKKVATVGSFEKAMRVYRPVCELTVLERRPRPGEYPDSACEYLLPEQDIVFLTGSAFVNKTMPRLLELCRGAETILLGPTVPLAPQLFDFGVDCLAGFVVTEPEACRRLAATGYELSPSPVGKRVRLSKEDRP